MQKQHQPTWLSIAYGIGHSEKQFSSLLVLKSKKFPDINFQNPGVVRQTCNRRRIHSTFHEANEFNRTTESFRKLFLSELLRVTKFGDATP